MGNAGRAVVSAAWCQSSKGGNDERAMSRASACGRGEGRGRRLETEAEDGRGGGFRARDNYYYICRLGAGATEPDGEAPPRRVFVAALYNYSACALGTLLGGTHAP